jgi:histidinol dehydrogenase
MSEHELDEAIFHGLLSDAEHASCAPAYMLAPRIDMLRDIQRKIGRMVEKAETFLEG